MSLLNETNTANSSSPMLLPIRKLNSSTKALPTPRPPVRQEQVMSGFAIGSGYELQDERLPSVSSF
jgi:hypothetical protein